jgi:hypothetical protein
MRVRRSSGRRRQGPASCRRNDRIAALGDLHVDGTDGHSYRDLFTEISGEADVLALCGDLTNLGKPAEAETLANDLRACRIPVVAFSAIMISTAARSSRLSVS